MSVLQQDDDEDDDALGEERIGVDWMEEDWRWLCPVRRESVLRWWLCLYLL